MPAKQSDWATGRKQAPVSREARGVVTERYEITVDEDLSANDILELAILPAYHKVVDAILITDAMGTGITVDVGIMSGDVGDPDDSRTSGNELFDDTDVAAAGVTRATKASAFDVSPSGSHRSIGVKVSGAVTASDQKVALVLSTVQ